MFLRWCCCSFVCLCFVVVVVGVRYVFVGYQRSGEENNDDLGVFALGERGWCNHFCLTCAVAVFFLNHFVLME